MRLDSRASSFDAWTHRLPTTITTTLPHGGHGPASVQSTAWLDGYGRPTWTKDEDGYIHYTAYGPATGAVARQIVDVDLGRTGEFSTPPLGLTRTGAWPAVHARTDTVPDAFGRPTQITDPEGNMTGRHKGDITEY